MVGLFVLLVGAAGCAGDDDDDNGTSLAQAKSGCVIGGCGGTVCGKASNIPPATCQVRAVDECYRDAGAICEPQAYGLCGWRETPALSDCLARMRDL